MLVLPAASAFQLSVLILLSWMCLSPDTTGVIDPKSQDALRGLELSGSVL